MKSGLVRPAVSFVAGILAGLLLVMYVLSVGPTSPAWLATKELVLGPYQLIVLHPVSGS